MTWKRFRKQLQIDKKIEKYHSGGFYTGSIGYLTQSHEEEIILITFDEHLVVYSKSGDKKLEIAFSNDVCKLFVGDLYESNDKIFVSLAYSGEIRVFTESEEVIWKLEINNLQDGFMDNMDYDDLKEIVVLHDDNKILILNNQGQEIAKYVHSNKITAITPAKINSNDKHIIAFSDVKDALYALDVEHSVTTIPTKIHPIIALNSITIFDKNILIVLDKDNCLNFLDKKGHLIERFKIPKEIDSFFTGYLFDKKTESLIIITRDSYLLVYELLIADSSEFIEKESSVKKEKSTSISTKPEKSTLQFNPNLFTKGKPTSRSSTSTLSVEKNVVPKQTVDNLELTCPECGAFLSRTIKKRILDRKTAFCEGCGLKMRKDLFNF